MHKILQDYSGVIINQNQPPSGFVTTTDSSWRYQDFFLPSDFVRDNNVIPGLSGFQLLAKVDDKNTVGLDWKIEYKAPLQDWVTISSGVHSLSDINADKSWITVIFNQEIEIPSELLDKRFRVGIKRTGGFSKIWLSSPNPEFLSTVSAKAYYYTGLSQTPIQVSGADSSFNFRILALVADEGVDFLGNKYRSAISIKKSANVDTLNQNSVDKIWMSKPNPSRFAVESLYFDIRKRTGTGVLRKNYVLNPSFETDILRWSNYTGAGSTVSLARNTAWANSGSASLKISGTSLVSGGNGWGGISSASGVNGYRINPLTLYMSSASINIETLPASHSVDAQILWYDAAGAFISSDTGTGVTTSSQVSVIATSPSNAVYATIVYKIVNGSGSTSTTSVVSIDSIQFVEEPSITAYFDGSYAECKWMGLPHQSASIKTIEKAIDDNPVVVDSVLVDPVTPGVYFHIYYSNDGSTAPTEINDWDNKLWRRVPKTFHALRRESHQLPHPISAKYIKIEFTHLQAKHYSPDIVAQSISYKKHPKWVLDYFLLSLSAKNSNEAKLSGRAGIIFDAYDLAYNYYLDDLKQEPEQPVEASSDNVTEIVNFIGSDDDLSDKMDPIMGQKIKTLFSPYTDHPSAIGNPEELLNSIASSLRFSSLALDYPIEKIPAGLFPDVAETRNSQTIFENDYPVMFFYLTCRHKYREIIAPLSHDRAYFVGINEIVFNRENYEEAYDGDQYLEIGADFYNTSINDFNNDNGILTVG